ncbi:MAG: sensor histidine kinase [Desulfuromonadales bacterium]
MARMSGWRPPAERSSWLSSMINMIGILTVIFLVELCVMYLLPVINGGQSPLMTSLIDATLLTIISSPFLWLIVARPLESAVLSEKNWGTSLLGIVRDGVVIFDRQGAIVMINRAAEELFGYPATEVVGRPFSDLVSPVDAAGHLNEASPPQTARAAGQAYHETTGRRRDGAFFPLEISISHAERDRHLYFVGILRDVSSRKRLEEEAAHAREDWEDVFTTITDAITIVDNQFNIVRANPAAEQLLGASKTTLLDSKCFLLFHGFTHAPAHCQSCTVLKTRVPSSLEFFEPHLHKYLEVKALPRFGRGGQPAGLVHVVRDITERKLAEQELQQKNAELERYVYTVSHDLKTPVVTIKMFLGLFEQHLDAGEAELIKADLHYLHAAGDRMNRLLTELLELARVGRVLATPVRISSRELIDEALETVAGAIAERRVMVRIAEEAVMLYGDRVRLMEIWQNLIDNAIKYMGDQPAPCIEIGLRQEADAPVFYVRDNGMGIAPQFHGKIFGLFEQLDPLTEGTGLGLAMVKRIVELYAGKIWVESAGAGQGACFYFTLPAVFGELSPDGPVGDEQEPPPLPIRSVTGESG